MKIVLSVLMLTSTFILYSQDVVSSQVKGLRIRGHAGAELPVAYLDSNPISIEFDINETKPPDVRLKFYHCDKDWNITNNSFINDDLRNTTRFPVSFQPAPAFVKNYAFHYTVQVPGFTGLQAFRYSGNYLFELWDKDFKELLGTGRFFVVENTIRPVLKVYNRYLPSGVSPWNQVHKIEVDFSIPDQGLDENDRLVIMFVNPVDVYRNRQLLNPFRIDVDDQNPNTFVDGLGLRDVKFIVDNVPPGNEYRRIDLRNVDEYPPDHSLRPRNGADVSRFMHQGPKDNNGISILTTNDRYADYMEFQFELLRDSDDLDSAYVVGDFNSWTPDDAWRMTYDRETKRYKLSAWLRRGLYEYQYVVGKNDWITLEGNDWRTINLYTAFIYYHDPRFGGFDRILGYVQGLSPGGVEPTTNEP